MMEPKLRPSMDVSRNSDDSVSDAISEPVSLSSSDVFLPHVLGPETFELEFFAHRRHTAPEILNHKTTTKHPIPPNKSPTTQASEILGRITTPDIRRWFRRPYEPEFLVHLLDLYFYWIHPSYQIFSCEGFLRDFRSGSSDHCSRLLANAVAAFACHYSDRMTALADPRDPSTAGDHFFAEAERLLHCGGESPLMLSRALSVMSSRELACGRTFTSHLYAERCQDMEYRQATCSTPTATGLLGGFETRPGTFQSDSSHMPGCW